MNGKEKESEGAREKMISPLASDTYFFSPCPAHDASFCQWDDLEPVEGDGDCVELDLTSPSYKWRNSQCSKKQPYVCRKLPLGRTFNCSCTGDSDSFNRGGYCKRWSADQPAWCYVSQVIRCPSLSRCAYASLVGFV